VAAHDAIVVGAGIAGAATAYELRRAGLARVLLLERGAPAGVGTGRSAAIVRQHYSTKVMARIAKAAVERFARLADELGRDVGYRPVGYLFIPPPGTESAAQANVAMQRELGTDTVWLGANALGRFDWLNSEGLPGAAYEAKGGYADPVATTEAYVAAFVRDGGDVRLKTPARRLLRAGDRITGVETDDGEQSAGIVVNAAGPFAGLLAATAGLDLPMRAVREQDTVWQGRPGRPLPVPSISDGADAIYVRPMGEGRFIVGRGFPKPYQDVDPYNFKETADDAFVADIQGRLATRFPGLADARLIHAYAALYDVTPDWYPFIGPRAGLAGYADFSGGSGHGFKTALAIAAELARWLTSGEAAEDFRQLSHDRVPAGRLIQQSYGGNRG